MYWSDLHTDTISRANLDGSQAEVIVTEAGADGIAIDSGAGKIYWTEEGFGKTRRANLDGSQVETLGTIGGADLALDVGQGKMYVADWWNIYRMGLGGSPIETLISDKGAATAIGLDLSRGKMYWGNLLVDDKKIRRANLDGTQVEVIVTEVGKAYDFAIDETGGKLYWGQGERILRANLDGSQVETLFTLSAMGLALDLGAGKIYWTESGGSVGRANLDGSQVETLVSQRVWFPLDIALGP